MNYFIAKPFFPFSRLIICTSFPRQKQKSPTVKTVRSIPSTYLARKKKKKKKKKEKKEKKKRKSFLSPCTRVAGIFLHRIFPVSNRFLRTPVFKERRTVFLFNSEPTLDRRDGGKYWG